jgi:hypothetical protein
MAHPLWMATTWLAPAIVALAVIRLRRPTITAAALVFVCGLLPVLGLTPFFFQYFSTVADRYLYLPMLGVAMAVAYVVSGPTRGVAVICTIGVMTLASISIVQLGYWRDTITLCRHAISVNPHTATPASILGGELENRGDLAGAATEYQRAIDNNPWLGRSDETNDTLRKLRDIDSSIPPELPHADPGLLRNGLGTVDLQPTPALRYSEEPDHRATNPGLRSTSDPASGL